MIQTIKKYLLNAMVAAALLTPFALAGSVAAQGADIQGGLCEGANLRVSGDVGGGNCNTGNPTGRVNSLIATVINIFSLIVGIVAVIMIIIGGLKYITSSGDSNNITSAKNTILYAIIGLIVVALAQFVVKFVLAKATGAGE